MEAFFYRKSDLARIILKGRYRRMMWFVAFVFVVALGGALVSLKCSITHPEDFGPLVSLFILSAIVTFTGLVLVSLIKEWRRLGFGKTLEITDDKLEEIINMQDKV